MTRAASKKPKAASRRTASTKKPSAGSAKRPKASSGRAASSKRGRRRQENAVVRYFRQTWAELRKVNWPTRREATNLTLIVLATTAAMSAFLGIVDYLSALLFSYLINPAG